MTSITLKLSAVLSLLLLSLPLPAQQGTKKQVPYPETSSRGNARIFYWGGKGSGGQVAVDFGTPVWKEAYNQSVEKMRNTRWRLGQNFWTTLDTNMDLVAGELEIPAGLYYLALERKDDDTFVLILLDPKEMRAKRLDAYLVPSTKGGLEVVMTHDLVEEQAKKLDLRLKLDPKAKDVAILEIHFGNHLLSAAFEMSPEEAS